MAAFLFGKKNIYKVRCVFYTCWENIYQTRSVGGRRYINESERNKNIRKKGKFDAWYKTKKWQKLRRYVLMRDKYLCQLEVRYGKRIDAEVVHHIFPVEEYPELFFNSDNLISLSKKAHNKMHNRMTDEITPEGRRLQEKVRKKVFVGYGEGEKT